MAGKHRKFLSVVLALATSVVVGRTLAAPPEPPPALETNPESERAQTEKKSEGRDRRPDSDGRKSDRDRKESWRDRKGDDDGRKGDRDHADEVPGKFRERFDALPAEAKKRFMENWSRWRKMDSREREKLMEGAFKERQRREEVIDKALADLGLNLTRDQREVFELRYRQERRKLEEALRDEVTSMRESRLKVMLEELRKEFAAENQQRKPAAD